MFRFIFGVACVILVIAVVIPARLIFGGKLRRARAADSRASKSEVDALEAEVAFTHGATWGGIILGIVFILWSLIRIVPANTVGIPTNFGTIGSPLSPGFHFTAPWTQVNKFPTRIQELSMLAAPDEGDKTKNDSISVIANGGGAMSVDLTIRFAVERSKASELFRQAGTMQVIKDTFIRPDARQVARDVFGQYTAEEGYASKRGEISIKITEALRPRLAERGLILDSVNVRDVAPDKPVLDAINTILKTRNDGLIALEQQKKEVTEAETRKQVAERDRDATVTKAQGDAQAITINADAQAQANAKIAASLTATLTDLEKTRLCADAIAKTQATVVNVCSGDAASGTANNAGVIVDARTK